MPAAFAGTAVSSPRHHAENAGINRRADLLAAYMALRSALVQEEVETWAELGRSYAHYTADAIALCKRLPGIRERDEQRESVRLQRLACKARLLLPVTVEDEAAERRQLVLEQDRDRTRLEALHDREHNRVHCGERIQLLIRAEDRKRYCLERSEAAAFGEMALDYSQTPWKPTIKSLGQCPFTRRAQCPFSDRWKLCHGMPLHENHYAHSIVDTIERGMM
jgi:hypothetical protein